MFIVDVFSTSLLCYLALSITDKTFLSSGRFFYKVFSQSILQKCFHSCRHDNRHRIQKAVSTKQ